MSRSARPDHLIVPKLVAPGGTLGLICTGSPTVTERLESGCAWLEAQGYRIQAGRSTEARGGLHALPPEERAAEFNHLILDPDIDAVLCVRGGSGTMGMLPGIDYDAVVDHPKPIIGLSDVTALHLALYNRSNLMGFSAHLAVQLSMEMSSYTADRWTALVQGPWPVGALQLPENHDLEVLHPGRAEGPILPCNLSLFAALIGTPYLPDLTGAILVLEEIDERPEGLDRMMTKISLSGVDRGLAGIILGQFTHCVPRNPKLTEQDGLDLVRQWATALGVPAIWGFPFGHEPICHALPFGARASIDTDPPSIELIDPYAPPSA